MFTKVASYSGIGLTFTLDNTVETTFVSGMIYRFELTAMNAVGESLPSQTTRIALAALPSAPANLAVGTS